MQPRSLVLRQLDGTHTFKDTFKCPPSRWNFWPLPGARVKKKQQKNCWYFQAFPSFLLLFSSPTVPLKGQSQYPLVDMTSLVFFSDRFTEECDTLADVTSRFFHHLKSKCFPTSHFVVSCFFTIFSISFPFEYPSLNECALILWHYLIIMSVINGLNQIIMLSIVISRPIYHPVQVVTGTGLFCSCPTVTIF